MAPSLAPPPPAAPPTSAVPPEKKNQYPFLCSDRRTFIRGLTAAATLGLLAGPDNARAAKRRPPPPPPEEKKDPNMSGVQAKVLASIKRKEAMKDAMAKMRERGKPVNSQPSEPSKQ